MWKSAWTARPRGSSCSSTAKPEGAGIDPVADAPHGPRHHPRQQRRRRDSPRKSAASRCSNSTTPRPPSLRGPRRSQDRQPDQPRRRPLGRTADRHPPETGRRGVLVQERLPGRAAGTPGSGCFHRLLRPARRMQAAPDADPSLRPAPARRGLAAGLLLHLLGGRRHRQASVVRPAEDQPRAASSPWSGCDTKPEVKARRMKPVPASHPRSPPRSPPSPPRTRRSRSCAFPTTTSSPARWSRSPPSGSSGNPPSSKSPSPFFLKNVLDLTLPAHQPEIDGRPRGHHHPDQRRHRPRPARLGHGRRRRAGHLVRRAHEVQPPDDLRRPHLERPDFIYRGPTGLDGWKQSGDKPAWTYQNSGFRSNAAGSIARNVNLPDECTVAFDAAWRRLLRPQAGFFLGRPDQRPSRHRLRNDLPDAAPSICAVARPRSSSATRRTR